MLQLSSLKNSISPIERLWDIWCVASVIGIWPRFIEPSCLFTKQITLPLPQLAKELEGLKILQISDLHCSKYTSDRFLKKIRKKCEKLSPDLIVFTGDLISYGELVDETRLEEFLSSLEAPLGCYAILGNHDYSEYVTFASDEKVRKVQDHIPSIMRGFARLFSCKDTSSEGEEVTAPIPEHPKLRALFERSGFTLLHNNTVQIGKGSSLLNLTGVGDIMACQCLPSIAFSHYNYLYPGIVLSHNPDSFDLLKEAPGDLLLFGHTHGGQVNLPFIWKRITPIRNKLFKSGLFHINNKFLYINRGLAAPFPFRWFAPPELTLFTLSRQGPAGERVWQRLFPLESTQEAAYGTP